jgi:hypothetical protein
VRLDYKTKVDTDSSRKWPNNTEEHDHEYEEEHT